LVRIGVKKAPPGEVGADLLAVGIHSGEGPPEGLANAAQPAVSSEDFTGKRGQTSMLYAGGDLAARRLMLVGLGDRSSFTSERLRRTAATVARKARTLKARDVGFVLPTPEGSDIREAARAAAEGAILGLYRFEKYKTKNNQDEEDPEAIDLVIGGSEDEGAASAGAKVGAKVASGSVLARDLANEPSNTATPAFLAERAREIGDRYGMAVTVLDRAGIEAEGLTGLATVGRSASNEPRFLVLEHRKGGGGSPVVIVGKAVTFDSGGISIKPTTGMEDMKFDMGGGAAVLGAMEAVGALDLPLDVVAIVPATENLPGGDAFKPGDVLTMANGKTVEILTTDAEGRLILADALARAAEDSPDAILETSTLTGAQLVALGSRTAGVMGSDDMRDAVVAASARSGEAMWAMPMPAELRRGLDSPIADFVNANADRMGGMLVGAHFLAEFVPAGVPWAHIDIAGPSYNTGSPWGYTPKGGTGVPVRTLLAAIEDLVAG